MGHLSTTEVEKLEKRLSVFSMRVSLTDPAPKFVVDGNGTTIPSTDWYKDWQYSISYNCQYNEDLKTVSNVDIKNAFQTDTTLKDIHFNGPLTINVTTTYGATWFKNMEVVSPINKLGGKFGTLTSGWNTITDKANFNLNDSDSDKAPDLSGGDECTNYDVISISSNVTTNNKQDVDILEYRNFNRVILEKKHNKPLFLNNVTDGITLQTTLPNCSISGGGGFTVANDLTKSKFILVGMDIFPFGEQGCEIVVERREYVSFAEYQDYIIE